MFCTDIQAIELIICDDTRNVRYPQTNLRSRHLIIHSDKKLCPSKIMPFVETNSNSIQYQISLQLLFSKNLTITAFTFEGIK